MLRTDEILSTIEMLHAELGLAFGIVDLSLAPTPMVGDSVGEILKTLGISRIGAPGSTAAVALLSDAVKKGGLFGSMPVAEVRNTGASQQFVHFGGRIPAPLQSLRN